MGINELKQPLKKMLIQTAAAMSTEIPDELDNFDKLEITVENRKAEITVEKQGVKVEESMLQNRLFKKVEEEARKHRPNDIQGAVEEEIAPLNRYEPDEEEEEDQSGERDRCPKKTIKDKL